jgi:hypothetical protein
MAKPSNPGEELPASEAEELASDTDAIEIAAELLADELESLGLPAGVAVKA